MASHANSTRTPLLPQSGSPWPLLGQGLGRQLGPVSHAIRAMRAADPADLSIAAIQEGLDRFFSETGIPVTAAELRRRIEDRIEADLALLDALSADPDLEDGHDAEGNTDDNGIADLEAAAEQRFPGYGRCS